MKIGLFIFAFIMSFGFASAACNLNVEIIYQDPYPSMPGEYVDVVFQLTGVENPECKEIRFELIEKYPFSLDPEKTASADIRGGIYLDGEFSQYWNIPYKIRVDELALEGENPLEVHYYLNTPEEKKVFFTKDFNITVEDVKTDFEISVKDYDDSTSIITFEILNVGEHDAEALTVEIPKQDNLQVKGGNRNIIGDLDANEDTTFNFEASPADGEIWLNILYNDEINVRREINEKVEYDSSFFTGRKAEEVQPKSTSFYVAIILGIILLIIIVRNWWKKRQRKRRFEEKRK